MDERLHRFDIRVDPTTGQLKSGTPLVLKLQVMGLSEGGCRPLAGARVDIWQCDAAGVYSDVEESDFNTFGHNCLRGYQVTDLLIVEDYPAVMCCSHLYCSWCSGYTSSLCVGSTHERSPRTEDGLKKASLMIQHSELRLIPPL